MGSYCLKGTEFQFGMMKKFYFANGIQVIVCYENDQIHFAK